MEDTCKPCGYGFYLIQPPMDGGGKANTGCIPCDVNAICSGRNSVLPKPNYFKLNDTTSEYTTFQIVKCYQDNVCRGGLTEEKRKEIETTRKKKHEADDDMLEECAKGYVGMMCASCATNYYKKTWIECAECGAYHNTCLWALVRLCWFTVFILGTVSIIQSIAVVKDDQK